MDLKKLEVLALRATPGEWMNTGVVVAVPRDGGMEYLLECCDGSADHPNLAFVEAAQPAVVLELIAEIRKLKGNT